MSELVLHPQTSADIQRLSHQMPTALLLLAPEGSGKLSVAKDIAARVLGFTSADALSSYPHVQILTPKKQTIPIDAIRELRQFTKLKRAGTTDGLHRLIIIEQAHAMTNEAQNALLKLLEEPPLDTAFILTATQEHLLLPTIRSRTQQVHLRTPSAQSLTNYFSKQQLPAEAIQQAYLMSGGLPGLMHALLHDEAHPLRETVELCRHILRSSRFERLCQVDSLAKSREACLNLVFVLQQMARTALKKAATSSGNTKTLHQWQHILTAAAEAEQALLANTQAKLVLTSLMLSL